MARTDDAYRCTLTQRGAAGRIDADRALAGRVADTEHVDDGAARVTFAGGPDTRRLVDTFVDNESRCCGFFDFAVSKSAGTVTLQITAPPEGSAQRLVDAAKEAFSASA